MRSTLIALGGPIVVNLPRPERYALHKLLIYGKRPQAQRTKVRKDFAQAAALLDYLLVLASLMAAQWVQPYSCETGDLALASTKAIDL